MKKRIRIFAIAAAFMLAMVSGAFAQNSAPAPGAGGSFTPNVGGGPGGGGPGPGWESGPGWSPGPAWGGPWGGGWNSSPTVIVNAFGSPSWQNNGVTNVVGVGYDAQGVYRTVPMRVSYNYNGSFYNVVVLRAWNPWTDMWDKGLDEQAYNTSYYLNGQTYDFYTVLPFGTFYFNL